MTSDHAEWVNPLKVRLEQDKKERKLLIWGFLAGIFLSNVVLIIVMNGGW